MRQVHSCSVPVRIMADGCNRDTLVGVAGRREHFGINLYTVHRQANETKAVRYTYHERRKDEDVDPNYYAASM